MRRAPLLLVTLTLLPLLAVDAARALPPVVSSLVPRCEFPEEAATRAVVLYASTASSGDRYDAIAEEIRELVNLTNGALSDATGGTRAYRVECERRARHDGTTAAWPAVHRHVLGVPASSLSFALVKESVLGGRGDAGPVNYWVWVDAPPPEGTLGDADLPLDRRWSAGNAVNRGGNVAVVWGGTPHSLDWRVLLHESMHTMGAVQPGAWEADRRSPGHTYAPYDLMAPRIDTPSITRFAWCLTPANCPECDVTRPRCGHASCDRWTLDCGNDTYYHPDPARPIVFPHERPSADVGWHVGSAHNAFLAIASGSP